MDAQPIELVGRGTLCRLDHQHIQEHSPWFEAQPELFPNGGEQKKRQWPPGRLALRGGAMYAFPNLGSV